MAQRRRQSDQALALLYHSRSATPFLSQDGQPCASVPTSLDSCRILPLRSADFRDWLTANYYSEFEAAPSRLALQAALRTLEARAQFGEGPAKRVDHRIGFEGDPYAPTKIFVDLANAAGEILEITSQGWSVTDNLRQFFRQSPGMLGLPYPQSSIPNPFPLLADLFGLTPLARTRVFFWLLAALRPTGPYPILVIRGPAGSGKSALARGLRTLVDPSSAPLRRLPVGDRELVPLALHNWILVFDPVQRVSPRMGEALCAISSGEAIETTQPDHRDSALTQIARPIILVLAPEGRGGPAWTVSGPVLNRSLSIELGTTALAAPCSEAALWRKVDVLRAPALAALANAVSCALRNLRDVQLENVARFPDAVAWAVAAAPAMGIDPAAIIESTHISTSSEVVRHQTQKHV